MEHRVAEQVIFVHVEEIFHDEDFNCRGKINPISVQELAEDIEDRGQDQAIIVEPWNKDGFEYRLICGHRRHKACEFLTKDPDSKFDGFMKAIVRDGLDDLERMTLNFSENVQREQLNLIQESKVVNKFDMLGLSRNDIAKRINKGGTWVQIRLYFSRLPEEVQKELIAMKVAQADIREFYSTYENCKKRAEKNDTPIDFEDLYQHVRSFKEGKNHKAKPKAKAKNEKRIRNKTEITDLIIHIRDFGIGAGMLTRLLAWAIGNVSNAEIDRELEKYHSDLGIPYTRLHEDGTE